jgi:hypothetical protein
MTNWFLRGNEKLGFLAVFGGMAINLGELLLFGFPIPTETSAKGLFQD